VSSLADVLFVKSLLLAIRMTLLFFKVCGFIFRPFPLILVPFFPQNPLSLGYIHTYEYYNTQWDLSLTKYYSGKPTEKNEIGGACSTYEGE